MTRLDITTIKSLLEYHYETIEREIYNILVHDQYYLEMYDNILSTTLFFERVVSRFVTYLVDNFYDFYYKDPGREYMVELKLAPEIDFIYIDIEETILRHFVNYISDMALTLTDEDLESLSDQELEELYASDLTIFNIRNV